jgi:LPS-assembly protein
MRILSSALEAARNEYSRMMSRRTSTSIAFVVASFFSPFSAYAQSASASDNPPSTPPDVTLKPAPQLVPPVTPASPRLQPTPGKAPAPSPPEENSVIFMRANSIEGVPEKYIEASGKVELRTRRETVLADWLHYDFVNDEIWGKGDVLVRRGIDWITGPEVRFKRTTDTGFFASPRFFIGENVSRGDAAEIKFAGPDVYQATDARYTTCVAPNEDWYLRMGDLEIDRSRMVGSGHDATIFFLGAPIVYSPYVEFSLSGERKSGFLTPTFGQTGLRGFEYTQPYYLNLAPNYDVTLVPRLMTKRGVQFGAQGRYLYDTGAGEASAEYLQDRVTDTNRYYLSWKHNENLNFLPGLSAYWNLNKASDDTYFADLSDRVGLTSQTTLPREGGFLYTKGPWQFIARAQAFQTLLDPSLPPGAPPYNRVPQFFATLQDVDWKGLTFAGTAEYADFRNSELVTGQRAYMYPTVAWTQQGVAWYFTAKTGIHMRHYSLNDTTPDRSTLDYAIPISSVDASVVYERDWSAFGQNFNQTLEPRAYYVYVPFRDQSAAPIFDTAIDDYNFTQIYSDNRYLGNDRIGDANQVTLGLTSRLLDPGTGAERLRMAVGERFYFQDQQVVLNEAPRSASTSDILLGLDGKLSDAWSLGALMQYNFSASQTERFNFGARWTPAPGKVINASWRYSRLLVDQIGLLSELKQFDISTQWPLSENWTLLGRWNYSLVDNRTLEAVAGIEYNGGCWVLRLVGQRLITATETTSNSIYLQLELNGLARLGTSPLDLLRRSVPGYQKSNDPTVLPRESGEFFQEF